MIYSGGCNAPMINALELQSQGLGLRPGYVFVLCSWAKHCTFTTPLLTQEY